MSFPRELHGINYALVWHAWFSRQAIDSPHVVYDRNVATSVAESLRHLAISPDPYDTLHVYAADLIGALIATERQKHRLSVAIESLSPSRDDYQGYALGAAEGGCTVLVLRLLDEEFNDSDISPDYMYACLLDVTIAAMRGTPDAAGLLIEAVWDRYRGHPLLVAHPFEEKWLYGHAFMTKNISIVDLVVVASAAPALMRIAARLIRDYLKYPSSLWGLIVRDVLKNPMRPTSNYNVLDALNEVIPIARELDGRPDLAAILLSERATCVEDAYAARDYLMRLYRDSDGRLDDRTIDDPVLGAQAPLQFICLSYRAFMGSLHADEVDIIDTEGTVHVKSAVIGALLRGQQLTINSWSTNNKKARAYVRLLESYASTRNNSVRSRVDMERRWNQIWIGLSVGFTLLKKLYTLLGPTCSIEVTDMLWYMLRAIRLTPPTERRIDFSWGWRTLAELLSQSMPHRRWDIAGIDEVIISLAAVGDYEGIKMVRMLGDDYGVPLPPCVVARGIYSVPLEAIDDMKLLRKIPAHVLRAILPYIWNTERYNYFKQYIELYSQV